MALVNHNVSHDTGQSVLPVATRDDIIDHLDIPLTRRVRRQLLSPEEYDRLLGERQVERQVAREQHRRLLARKRRARERLAPWLLVACVASLVLLGIGLLLHFGANSKAAGLTLLTVGGVGLIAASVTLACVHLDESSHAGRPPVGTREPIETHETVTVPNEEVDEELDWIERFVASVARSAADNSGQTR